MLDLQRISAFSRSLFRPAASLPEMCGLEHALPKKTRSPRSGLKTRIKACSAVL
jgi:hypothetical protein